MALMLVGLGAQAAGPFKYPPDVTPISRDNVFLRGQSAPDYWRLSPYLEGQKTNSSCSLASMTYVLNGFMDPLAAGREDQHLTEQSVLQTTGNPFWRRATANNGGGLGLKDLEPIALQALVAHGFHDAVVERVSFTGINRRFGLSQFEMDLIENERSAEDFIVINFDQAEVMEEPTPYGHYSVVGAYDSRSRRVLVLDTDRDWYEPYWVPLEKLFDSMDTQGYLKIRAK
jgi:hypothetical protein